MENFKPQKIVQMREVIVQSPFSKMDAFDPILYLQQLQKTFKELEVKNPVAAQQFREQESIKVRYKVAEAEAGQKENKIPETTQRYVAHKSDSFDTAHVSISENVPELQYSQVLDSPIYEYEKALNMTPAQKIEMLSKLDIYLRARGIYTIFTDKIVDSDADIQKPWEIEEGKNYRDLPIAELVGNKILINPKNVDFLSTFLSIGHIYGHLVQRTEPEEYIGITRFLEYPKPLDLALIQKEYDQDFGGEYKKEFKIYEEEAFAYAKYTFQQAGVIVTPELEYAMRVYIEADFEELWKWSTSEPQKDATDFMQTFTRIYKEQGGTCVPLSPKEVSMQVAPDKNGRIQVVRDGMV